MNLKMKYKAKKIKAVFFDIDDTLRHKNSGVIPDSAIRAIKQLQAQGIKTGVATGRAPYGITPEIKSLGLDYFVTINGAYVYDKTGRKWVDQSIDPKVVASYVAWCREVGIGYGFAGESMAAVSEDSDFINDIISPFYTGPDCVVDPDFYKTHSVYHMWTFETQGDSLQLKGELAEQLRFVRWHPNSSDVVAKNSSKATGLAILLDDIGLKPSEVLFFGDGLNDLEMFDVVGLKVAMGNSVPVLKEKADFVTKDILENGIAYALEELGMVKKEITFPQLEVNDTQVPRATIKTNLGDLQVVLFPDEAPKTVANFIALAKDGYYDGVIFHRVINDF